MIQRLCREKHRPTRRKGNQVKRYARWCQLKMDAVTKLRDGMAQRFTMSRAQPSEEGYESHASTSSLSSQPASVTRNRQSNLVKSGEEKLQGSDCGTKPQIRDTIPMIRTSSSGAVVNIAVRNEEGQPDFVEIDTADDEEEDCGDIMPLENFTQRIESSDRIRAVCNHPIIQPNAQECSNGTECIIYKIRHQSIAERVLKRRNSEHALQQAMNVAESRKKTLARLLHEHQELVKEVEKWSSLASLKDKMEQSPSGVQRENDESVDQSMDNVCDEKTSP